MKLRFAVTLSELKATIMTVTVGKLLGSVFQLSSPVRFLGPMSTKLKTRGEWRSFLIGSDVRSL